VTTLQIRQTELNRMNGESEMKSSKRDIVMWPFPCADGTWGVAFKQTGEVESYGYETELLAEEHIKSKPEGEFGRFVLYRG